MSGPSLPSALIHADYLGKSLYVGATVVFIANGYREFQKGVIVKETAQKVRIAYARGETLLRYPQEVVLVS